MDKTAIYRGRLCWINCGSGYASLKVNRLEVDARKDIRDVLIDFECSNDHETDSMYRYAGFERARRLFRESEVRHEYETDPMRPYPKQPHVRVWLRLQLKELLDYRNVPFCYVEATWNEEGQPLAQCVGLLKGQIHDKPHERVTKRALEPWEASDS